MKKEEVVNLVKEVFSEMWSSNFCGCFEGDLDGEYERGVAAFIEVLEEKMAHLTKRAPDKCLRCAGKGWYLIGCDEIRCQECNPNPALAGNANR